MLSIFITAEMDHPHINRWLRVVFFIHVTMFMFIDFNCSAFTETEVLSKLDMRYTFRPWLIRCGNMIWIQQYCGRYRADTLPLVYRLTDRHQNRRMSVLHIWYKYQVKRVVNVKPVYHTPHKLSFENESRGSSFWRLWRRWWHHELSLRQLALPSVTAGLSVWWAFIFNARCTSFKCLIYVLNLNSLYIYS